jgi:hypothetical protein
MGNKFKGPNGEILYIDKEKDITKCVRCGGQVIQKPGAPKQKEFCPVCLKKYRIEKLKQARKKKFDMKLKEEQAVREKVISPCGDDIYVNSQSEKDFYNKRKQAYLKEFEMGSAADQTMLSVLLYLELECKRVASELGTNLTNAALEKTLRELTDQVRKIQTDLGIIRGKRLEKENDKSANDVLEDIMSKFRRYKKEHKDEFVWVCSNCKHKNVLHKRNKGDYIEGRDEKRIEG